MEGSNVDKVAYHTVKETRPPFLMKSSSFSLTWDVNKHMENQKSIINLSSLLLKYIIMIKTVSYC